MFMMISIVHYIYYIIGNVNKMKKLDIDSNGRTDADVLYHCKKKGVFFYVKIGKKLK